MDANETKRLGRQTCLEIIGENISKASKHSGTSQSFCCYTDIQQFWGPDQFADIFYDSGFSDGQFSIIRKQQLRFLSFVVWSGICDASWFSSCRQHLFCPPTSDQTAFSDDNLPLSQRKLERLGFGKILVERNHVHQYHFIPTMLDFSVRSDVQMVEPSVRLPLEFRANEVENGGYGSVEVRIPVG